MNTKPEIQLTTTAVNKMNYFVFKVDHGELRASKHAESDDYYISNVDVNLPRHKIGKLLMAESGIHAEIVGAKRIIAAIVSRECLESMEAVFGAEHIAVKERGDYEGEGGAKTSAVLVKNLV